VAETVELPVFELPLAALPAERVPLHIFEQRYREMIGHCIDSGASFGIVLRTDEGARSVGCAAEVTDVLERFDDGRMNILATGSWRFRVLDRYEGDSFPMGPVEPLAEPDESEADPTAARDAFRRLLEEVGSRAEPPDEMRSAYGIAGRVEIPVETKQRLLESDSESERLELLRAALEDLIAEVGRSKRIAEIAQGNGRAPVEGLRPPDAND
jgi:Lon protease-like protein